MGLWRELRRRHVYRMSGFYVVGAWLIIQVADVFFPAWGLPETALRFLIVAAILCFPIALVENIRKPMLVQQGVNDPRVPKSESDQIVASLKDIGTPTWYLVFDDEGHGFRKKGNADFAFNTVIMFAKDCLLN